MLALSAQVVGNDRVGRVQNGLGGAVILFQTDDPGPGILLLKGQNVLNGGTPEAVNALVIVAHHADIAPVAAEQAGEQILDMVGILILVNQHILEFALVVFPDLRFLLQKLYGYVENVVKIQGVVVLQPLLVGAISFGNLGQPQVGRTPAVLKHFFWRDQPVLLAADDREHIFGWEGFVIQPHVLQNLFHLPLGIGAVVDGKAAGVAHPVDISPQNPAAGSVEGHGPDVPCPIPQQGFQPLPQLSGGLIGKGDGDDVPGLYRLQGAQPVGPDPLVFAGIGREFLQKTYIRLRYEIRNLLPFRTVTVAQKIGNPVDENRGFSGTGPGQKQQGPFRGEHRLPLHIVEHGKAAFDIVLPGRKKTHIQRIVHRSTCHFSDLVLPFYYKSLQNARRISSVFPAKGPGPCARFSIPAPG